MPTSVGEWWQLAAIVAYQLVVATAGAWWLVWTDRHHNAPPAAPGGPETAGDEPGGVQQG